jgi:hypothetical protein
MERERRWQEAQQKDRRAEKEILATQDTGIFSLFRFLLCT